MIVFVIILAKRICNCLLLIFSNHKIWYPYQPKKQKTLRQYISGQWQLLRFLAFTGSTDITITHKILNKEFWSKQLYFSPFRMLITFGLLKNFSRVPFRQSPVSRIYRWGIFNCNIVKKLWKNNECDAKLCIFGIKLRSLATIIFYSKWLTRK